MASRAKRPVSVSDAFRLEEDDARMPKDAKMSRNMGSITAAAGAPPKGNEHTARSFWQEARLAAGQKQISEHVQMDGTSSILNGQVGLGNSGSNTGIGAEASAATMAPMAQAGSPLLPADASPARSSRVGFYFCWLCKRKFVSSDDLDRHALYSRLHQDSVRRLAGLSH
mmetsp:Transcript_49316/g.107362  ORF Transcript_49316/g.107362 Transcript_49316/m.107362 type:complete len:169 (-) Transcript_49316:206-712(-)